MLSVTINPINVNILGNAAKGAKKAKDAIVRVEIFVRAIRRILG
jgi:hypothetical protein